MCEFLDAGHLGRHIRRTRDLFATRLATLRDSVHAKLAGVLDVPESDAGTHVAAWLRPGLQADALSKAASARDIDAIPIRRFVLRTPRPEGFLLGFAAYTPRQIREGVEVLAAVIEGHLRKSDRAS
jgi:GntR family transcriptional regulator/MocR family aminotransferase